MPTFRAAHPVVRSAHRWPRVGRPVRTTEHATPFGSGMGCEGVAHRSPFVGMRSEDLEHAETDASDALRGSERFARSSFPHAHVFVAMPDAIGAMR